MRRKRYTASSKVTMRIEESEKERVKVRTVFSVKNVATFEAYY